MKTENFEQVAVTSVVQLRHWLEANHAQRQSIWLVTYKKHMTHKYVSVQEILDQVLCFGWIDGVRRKLNDDQTMQLIGPRRRQHWAQSYKDRAAKLVSEGRMHRAGLEAIAESKRLGLWEHMDDVDALEMPEDLIAALRAQPAATDYFAAFSSSSKRFVLRWIKLAKTPETRAEIGRAHV